MSGLVLILGIILLIVIIRRPAGEPLFSTTLKIVVGLLFLIFAAYVVFIAIHVPAAAAYLIGQAFGALILVAIFVAAGTAIRNHRDKKKETNPTP
jgi:hypothetical protein